MKKGAGIFLALTISLFLVFFLSCGAQRERHQKETRKRAIQPLKAKPIREKRKRTPEITLKRNPVVCSAENTFAVFTCQDLMNMKNNLAACYVLSNDIVNNLTFSFPFISSSQKVSSDKRAFRKKIFHTIVTKNITNRIVLQSPLFLQLEAVLILSKVLLMAKTMQ